MSVDIRVHCITSIKLGPITDFPDEGGHRKAFSTRELIIAQDDGTIIYLPLYAAEHKSILIVGDPPDDDDEEDDDFVDLGGEGHVHGSFDGIPVIVDKRIPSLKEGDIVIGRPMDPEAVFPAAAAMFEKETDATRNDVRGAMS